jgi:hypothetical protein
MKKIYMQPECECLVLQEDVVRTSNSNYGYDGDGSLEKEADNWEW